MIVRDSIGNTLAEGDVVLLPLNFGAFLPANVSKVNALVSAADPNSPPTIQIVISLTLGVDSAGRVPNVVKVPQVGL